MYDAINAFLSNDDNFYNFFWDCAAETMHTLEAARDMRGNLSGDALAGLTYDMAHAVNSAISSNGGEPIPNDHAEVVRWISDNYTETMGNLAELD